jgi:23S rRNA pseudouridine2605 synthase
MDEQDDVAGASTDGTQKLQKILAQAGLGSRRDMEELIQSGRVTVNGQVAELGMRVSESDLIRANGRPIKLRSADRLPRVLLYYKPEGEIVSRNDPEGRTSVFDRISLLSSSRWVAVGRLDFNTSGLLIFTTSGELANLMTHPRFEVEREYAVRLLGELMPEQVAKLKEGIELEDGFAKFDGLKEQGGEGSNHWYRVVLKEGRNREVRRMFEAVGIMVSRLMRVRFGAISLPPRLKRGQWVELGSEDVVKILKWAGMSIPRWDSSRPDKARVGSTARVEPPQPRPAPESKKVLPQRRRGTGKSSAS